MHSKQVSLAVVGLSILTLLSIALVWRAQQPAALIPEASSAPRARSLEAENPPFLEVAQTKAVPQRKSEGTLLAAASTESVLAAYKAWAKYPPDSRPLKAEQIDVVAPHIIASAPRQVVRRGADGKAQASKHFCVLQPQRHTVIAGEVQHITLTCNTSQHTDLQDTRVPVEVVSFAASIRNPKQQWSIPLRSPFADDGTSGDAQASDGVYTASLAAESSQWGDTLVAVRFRIPSEDNSSNLEPFTLTASYTSATLPPARFTGNFAEQLRNGSLVIDVELNVEKPGTYQVMANLFQGESPVGYAKNQLFLESGTQRVSLWFFGKVFRDQDVSGQFRLVDVRGYRSNSGIEPHELSGAPEDVDALLAERDTRSNAGPEREPLAPYPRDYTTKNYNKEQFSDREWDSESKRRHIQDLEQSIAEERAAVSQNE
jgi:hypothetical protein